MIIVKNRELLIPNNERYIGTTYDTETENRIFQVPRCSQRGVDLAALTFRLDIQYANNSYDTVILDKEVDDEFVLLIWRITSATLQVPGTMYIGLRAIDGEATVKWSSFSAAMYVERHLNTPGNYGGSLTEIEQMEQDHQYMKGVVDELKEHIDYTFESEAWAVGERDGEDVPSSDPAYHNNSKYYKEQAATSATNAAASATEASESAIDAAETVADTNTRFSNALAAVTVDTEVADGRVGADSEVYTVLGDAVRGQVKKIDSEANEALNQNLFTMSGRTDGKYLDASGTEGSHVGAFYTKQIAVEPGLHVLSFDNSNTGSGSWNLRILAYNSNRVFVKQIKAVAVAAQAHMNIFFDVFANVNYLAFSFYSPSHLSNIMLRRSDNFVTPTAVDKVSREEASDIRARMKCVVVYPEYDSTRIDADTGINIDDHLSDTVTAHCLTRLIGASPYYGVDAVSLNAVGYVMRLHGFNSYTIGNNTTYVGATNYLPCDGSVVEFPHAWKSTRIEIAKSDESSISSSEITALAAALKLYRRDPESEMEIYASFREMYDGMLYPHWRDGIIDQSTGICGPNGNNYIYTDDFIAVDPGDTLLFKKLSSDFYFNIYEYDAANHFGTSFIKVGYIQANYMAYKVSDTTRYVRFDYANADHSVVDRKNLKAVIYKESSILNKELTEIKRLGLHEMPSSIGMLNAIKRSRQITDIKWTPSLELPRVSMLTADTYADHIYFYDRFDANKEYEGVPYSQYGNPIGEYVPFDRFATSLSHPGSALNLLSGITPGDVNKATYYGGVCVDLVSYAFCIPRVQSSRYTYIPGMTKVLDVMTNGVPNSLDDLRLCDVLTHTSHVALITDIIRDSNGSVTHIEVSDLTKAGNTRIETLGSAFGGIARRKMWPAKEFSEWFKIFADYRYPAYRFPEITYKPNKYAPIEALDGRFMASTDLPIIPYYGDHYIKDCTNGTASNRVVKLVINSDTFSHVQVQKNGADYGGPLQIQESGGVKYVNVQHSQNEEAVFTAFLCNLNGNNTVKNRSASCTWMTFGAPTRSVSVSDNVMTVVLTRKTPLILPWYVSFGSSSDGHGSINGYYAKVRDTTVEQSGNDYVITFSVPLPSFVEESISCVIVNNTDGYGTVNSSSFTVNV